MNATDPNPVAATDETESSDTPSEHEMPDADAIDARIESGDARRDAEAAFGGESASDAVAPASDHA